MPKKKSPRVNKSQLSLFNGERKIELPVIRLKKSNFKSLREKQFSKYTNKEEFLKSKQKVFDELKRRYNKYDTNPNIHPEINFGKNFMDDVKTDLTRKLNLLQEHLIDNIKKEVENNLILKNKENKALYRLLFVYKREGADLLKTINSLENDLNYIYNVGPKELRLARSSQDVNEIHQVIELKSNKLESRKQKFIDKYCDFRAKYSILSNPKFLNEFAPRFNLKFVEHK